MKPGTLLIMLMAIVLAAGCTQETSDDNPTASALTAGTEKTNTSSPVQRLEIIHFHGTRQCTTCIAIGQYANDTLNTYFSDELNQGKITFQSINYDETENKLIAMKYDAVASSLWIGTYTDTGFEKQELRDVWYKTGDKQEYMTYLKGVIEENLE